MKRSFSPSEKLTTGDVPEIDKKKVKEREIALFSLGCFWGPDALFGSLSGILRTEVGYAGGKKKKPTYRDLGDHTESIRIEYNPDEITYKDLLDNFWRSHDPTRIREKQYRSMIFHYCEKQKILAQQSKDVVNKEPRTVIKAYRNFYPAEDYHQKYHLSKNKALNYAFRSLYPEMSDYIGSTAVARVNGYVAGHGTINSKEELERLGLTEEGCKLLYNIWNKSRGS